MGTPDMPPGWYPDPTNDRQIRWWDGNEWDLSTRPGKHAQRHGPIWPFIVMGVVVIVLAAVGGIVIYLQNETDTTPSGNGPVITGTVNEWIASVCLPDTETDIAYRGMRVDLYQHATTAQRCFNETHEPVAVATYASESDLALDLSCRYAGWWTTTELEDGNYLIFRSNPTWTREQSSLLPLEQFGFTITLEKRELDGTTPQWCYAEN